MKKWLLASLLMAVSPLSFAFSVSYSGCVKHNIMVSYDHKVDLLTLIKSVPPSACAFEFAAAISSKQKLSLQHQEKKSLLLSLQSVKGKTASQPLKKYLASLITVISNQPVTGRLVGWDLNRTHVETLPFKNRVINYSVSIHYPAMPKTIEVCVNGCQSRPYDYHASIEDYLKPLSLNSALEAGKVILVQSNGEIKMVKVGLWTHQKFYIAPGSYILGVMPSDEIESVDSNLNNRVAKWFATQVLK